MIWPNIGVQKIKLTAVGPTGCFNIYERCIEVIEIPTAQVGINDIAVNDTVTICKGSELFFDDLSTGNVETFWNFGTGDYSAKRDPSFTYATAGNFSLILSVKNQCGCFDRDTLNVIVEDTQGPEIICPSVVCKGDTVSYSTNASCSNFNWSVTNGSIIGSATQSTVAVVWDDHLGYIELDAGNCFGNCEQPTVEKIAVMADSIPIYGGEDLCNGDLVTFWVDPIPGSKYIWSIDPSLGSITKVREYEVDVDLSNQASGNIYVNYSNDILGCSGVSALEVFPKPRLNLTYSSQVCASDSMAIYEIPFPANWQLRNDTDSIVLNVLEANGIMVDWTAYDAGNYTLFIDGSTYYCNSLNLSIELLEPILGPDTIYGASLICDSNAYVYSVSPKEDHAVEWQIQGGTPSQGSGEQITVNWDGIPPYSVTAAYRQIEEPNCLSIVRTKVVSANSVANKMILAQDSACGGDTSFFKINFVANNVEWELIPSNAGAIITDRFSDSIQVVFDAANTQSSVTVRAIGSVCGESFVLNKNVFSQGFVLPLITVSDPSPCAGVPIVFNERNYNNAADVSWLIDELSYDTLNPTITFDTAKSVQAIVTVEATGPGGCTVTLKESKSITVLNSPDVRIAVLDTNKCGIPQSPIELTAGVQGSGAATYSYTWYKDGQFYSSFNQITIPPGAGSVASYMVIASTPNLCMDSAIYDVDTNCAGGGCIPLQNDTTFIPNPIDTIVQYNTVDLIFSQTGCGEYMLNSVNTQNCSLIDVYLYEGAVEANTNGPFQIGFNLNRVGKTSIIFKGTVLKGGDTLCFEIIEVFEQEVIPDFNYVISNCGTNGYHYTLNNTTRYSGSTPTSLVWDFGQNFNQLSAGYNPVVIFAPGINTVTLTDTNTNCSVTKEIDVPFPTIASFNIPSPICQQEAVSFQNLSGGNIISYRWEIGSQSSYDQSPKMTFTNPDNTIDYNQIVNLIILDANGCRDTATQIISVKGNQFDGNLSPVSIPPFCMGDSATLQYEENIFSQNPNTPFSYNWSDGSFNSVLVVRTTGDYSLELIDNVGCRTKTDPINVQVNQSPSPSIVGKEVFCPGEEVVLRTHNFPSLGVRWFRDSVFTGETDAVYREDLSPGSYQFYIEFTDSSSMCSSSSAFHSVELLSTPASPNIVASATPVCEKQNIQLSANLSSQQFYWSNGEFGNSITAYTAAFYEVFYSTPSGCIGKDTITVHPLPDFSNFMLGCYCIPDSSAASLLGVPNMSAWQWKNNGIDVPAPAGNSQNLVPSNGSYSLIATSNHGCIDSAGTIDITKGGCADCDISINNIVINCESFAQDSLVFSFAIETDFNSQDPGNYNLNVSGNRAGNPLDFFGLSSNQINSSTQSVTGYFILDSLINGDSICIQLIGSNPGVNCVAEYCIPVPDGLCDFTPTFDYSVNPYSCELTVFNTTEHPNCLDSASVSYSWSVRQDDLNFSGTGSTANFNGLKSIKTTICVDISYINPIDSSLCVKTICKNITMPSCDCNDNCSPFDIADIAFESLDDDSCLYTIRFEMENPSSTPISINYIGADDGTVLSYGTSFAGPGISAFVFDFLADSTFEGGISCFELHLKIDGVDCCIPICVNLPSCACDLGVFNVNTFCNAPDGSPGELNFEFDAELLAALGFDYATNLSVTYNGNPVSILNWQPNTIDSGTTTVSGLLDINNPVFGDSICFEFEAEFQGRQCLVQFCVPLPTDSCYVDPDFSYSFDPVTCDLTLTTESLFGSCTFESSYNWFITNSSSGQSFTRSGSTVQLSAVSGEEFIICHNTTGLNFYNNQDCHPDTCITIVAPGCDCGGEPCQGIDVSKTVVVSASDSTNPCTYSLSFDLGNDPGLNYTILGINSAGGQVRSFQNIGGSSISQTFNMLFQPYSSLNGEEICFTAYVLIDEVVCCIEICFEIPDCEELMASGDRRLAKPKEDEGKESLLLYPQPTSQDLNIVWSSADNELVNIEIRDREGRLVNTREVQFTNDRAMLSIHGLANGIYFIRLSSGVNTVTEKFSILR